MKTVLLTGATGFIGRQAIGFLLEKGFQVHAVSSALPDNLFTDEISWHQANLLNPVEVENLTQSVKATHLLHFAWYVEHGKFWNAPENELWLKASLNLLDNFRRAGGERVVMSGTCAEYEWGRDAVLSESGTPLKPATFYGECKLKLQESLAESGLDWAWGRIFFLYGERESPRRLVASVIRSLLKDEFADCSHGNQIRDFLYVKDVADAFVELLDAAKVSGAVNIGSGEAVSIKKLVLHIAELLDKRDKVRFGAIAAPANEPESIVADVARLFGEIGWRPKYDLASGIRETIDFWKNEIND